MEATLYISDELADLGELNFTFDINIKDAKDLTTIRSSKSSSIIIPATARNKKLLDYLDDPRISKSTVLKSAKLEIGALNFNGKLKTYEAENDNGNIEYRIQVISNSGDWTQAIKGLKVNELDFSNDDHILSAAVVSTSETFSTSTNFLTRRNYVYPIVSYGKTLDEEKINIVERYPSFNIRSIIYRMFYEIGYDVQGTLGVLIEKLHLLYTGKGILNDLSEDEMDDALYSVYSNDTITNFNIPASATGYPVSIIKNPISMAETFDNGGNYSTFTDKYTAPISCSQSFEVTLKSTWQYTSAGSPTIVYYLMKNSTILVFETTTPLNGVVDTVSLDSGYINIEAGDEIYVKATLTDIVDNPLFNIESYTWIIINTTSTLTNDTRDWYGEGSTVEISDILPDTTQIAFLKGIFQLFNVIPLTDNKRRIVYLNAKINNFTGDRLVFNQDQSKKVIIIDPTRTDLKIGYKTDGSDSQILTDLEPYEYAVTEPDDLEENINGIFASTLMDIDFYSTGNYTTKFPKIWKDIIQKDTSGILQLTPWDTQHDLRILYYNGVQSGNWTYRASGSDTARTTYPDMLSYNSTSNYNFKDIAGVTGLFNTYWQSQIIQINNSQIVKVYFNINTNQLQGYIDAELNRDARSYIFWEHSLWEVLSIKKINVLQNASVMFEIIKK